MSEPAIPPYFHNAAPNHLTRPSYHRVHILQQLPTGCPPRGPEHIWPKEISGSPTRVHFLGVCVLRDETPRDAPAVCV